MFFYLFIFISSAFIRYCLPILTVSITDFPVSILVQLSLAGYSLHNLCYLNQGDISQNETEDASRFEAWKASDIFITFFGLYNSLNNYDLSFEYMSIYFHVFSLNFTWLSLFTVVSISIGHPFNGCGAGISSNTVVG